MFFSLSSFSRHGSILFVKHCKWTKYYFSKYVF